MSISRIHEYSEAEIVNEGGIYTKSYPPLLTLAKIVARGAFGKGIYMPDKLVPQALHRLVRCPGDMWGEDKIRAVQIAHKYMIVRRRLCGNNIKGRASNLASIKGGDDIIFMNKAAT